LPTFQPQIVLGQDLRETFGIEHCPCIRSVADIAYCFEGLKYLKREVMVAGALDCKSRLLSCEIISVGTTDRLYVRIGESFKPVIKSCGSAIFLVHNHPSGSLTPSSEDMELTRRVAEAGLLLGYAVVDHVIISTKGHRSLLSAQTLAKYSKDLVVNAWQKAVVADQPAKSIAWRCKGCGRSCIDSVSTSMRECCIAVKCLGCNEFSWLNAKGPASKVVS